MFGINWPWPVLNAGVCWTTIRRRQGWEVQRNDITGHARIIDPNDIRRAWGSESEMIDYFDYIFRGTEKITNQEIHNRLDECIKNCRNRVDSKDLW